MYHTGIIRIITETGLMPVYDLSYGGLTRSFYVPAYRLFVASLSVLSNTDPIIASGLAVIAFSTLAIVAAYLLGKELGGEWAGFFSALLFTISPEIMIYTIRPFPEVLGIPLFLLALYFISKKDRNMAILASVLIALTHQATAVALGSVLLVRALTSRDKNAAISLACAALAYAVWQGVSLGSINIMGMNQIMFREGSRVGLMHVDRIGWFALFFGVLGIPHVLSKMKKYGLLLSFLVATVILANNELLGIGIFSDRFFTFFAIAVVFVAGIGMSWAMEKLGGKLKWK